MCALLIAAVLPGLASVLTRAAGVPLAAPWGSIQLHSSLAWLLANAWMFYVGPAQAVFAVGMLLAGRLLTRSDRGAWLLVSLATFCVNLWVIAVGQPWTLLWPATPVVASLMFTVPTVVLLARQGLLALAVCLTIAMPLLNTPVTSDLNAWYFWRTAVIIVIVCGVALWGFRNVLGKQTAFPAGTLEE